MTNFKHKLDEMFGDTSASEQRIQQNVKAKLMRQKRRRPAWQVPTIASLATAIALFLVMTTVGAPLFSTGDGRGVPYDPLDDLYTINTLKGSGELSDIDMSHLAQLEQLYSLTPLQYVDVESFMYNETTYAPVVERQERIYDDVVYAQGELVRTKTYSGSHLPVYKDEYYEIIAVPGDRIYLRDGELKVNGKRVDSALLERYDERNVTLAGGYEQVLNAREYVVLNAFPANDTVQGVAIVPVHKIYGEVVGITTMNEQQLATPDEAFDSLLYNIAFLGGEQREQWLVDGYKFPYDSRAGEFFLEASYRIAIEKGNTVELRYDFMREHGTVYTFTMYNVNGQWKLGPNK